VMTSTIFLQQVMYTNNMLQINGHVNRHNYHIWGQDGPYEIYKHVPYSLTLWCSMVHYPIIRPFFYAENNIVANIYLDMWVFVFPQLMAMNKKTNVNFFQQDGARLHLGHEVRHALNFVFPNSGQKEANTMAPLTSRCLTKGLFSVGIYNESPLCRENLKFTSSARWINTSALRVEMPQ
jgi:hypothetical protein